MADSQGEHVDKISPLIITRTQHTSSYRQLDIGE